MPYATTDDGVRLCFTTKETGSGRPLIFVHEFAGDLRSWEPQMRHFGKRYRAIAYKGDGDRRGGRARRRGRKRTITANRPGSRT